MKIVAAAAAVEFAAGLILAVSPTLVSRLVLNADLDDAGQAIGRLGGFGLLSLGLACWPGIVPVGARSATARALLAYNGLAAILFTDLGVRHTLVGVLLWPAAVLHAVLSVLLAYVVIAHRDR